MIVAGDDDAGLAFGQRFPDRRHEFIIAMRAGRVARMMPEGEYARRVGIGEVLAKPLQLLGVGADVDVAVEGDDVPALQFGAVITLAVLAGLAAEVSVITGAVGGLIFVVAGRGLGACFEASPTRFVAFLEIETRTQ